MRVLKSAKGATVTDASGKTLLDGFAGLWCVNLGYGQESIVEAAAKQMSELPYATGYFGLGSEPAIRLAARLAELAPGRSQPCLFHAWRLRRYRQHDPLHSLLLPCQGRAAEGPVHLGRAWLPWLLDGRIRPDRDCRLSMRVSACHTTGSTKFLRTMPIAILSVPTRRRSSMHRSRPCGPKSRNSARSALRPSTPNPSRVRAVSSFRRQVG